MHPLTVRRPVSTLPVRRTPPRCPIPPAVFLEPIYHEGQAYQLHCEDAEDSSADDGA